MMVVVVVGVVAVRMRRMMTPIMTDNYLMTITSTIMIAAAKFNDD